MITAENPSSALQTFDFKENPVRALERDGQPWFVAADVCRVLEIGNASYAVNGKAGRKNDLCLAEDERGIASVHTPSGDQQMLVVNESGLYALIFKSRKPQAQAFRKWVTSEVLPNIRKHGFHLNSALDFEKYPVAKEFSDIFVWLRSLQVDPNEAAGVARAILQSSIRERRRELPAPSRYSDEEQMARRDMQRLVELVVSYMRGAEEHTMQLHDVLYLARKHRLFLWMFDRSDTRHISPQTRIGFGILLNRFSGRSFQIGAELFSFTRHGSKNVRKYLVARLAAAVS